MTGRAFGASCAAALARAAALAVLAALAGGCAGGEWRATPEAVQKVNRGHAPHTTAQGAPLAAYDAARSFFPIGIYNVLAGIRHGRDHRGDFKLFAASGFNTAFAWVNQDLSEVLDSAEAAGLQIVWHHPDDAQLAATAGHARVLGYDVDHDPSLVEPDEWTPNRLAEFARQRARIRARDALRPVFAVDAPAITDGRRESWLAWKRAGDVGAVWKYPFMRPPVDTLSGPRGVPEIVTLAGEAMAGRPMWYVAQAFQSPILDWYMPDAREARAMVYAALVHGATGIIWFSADSHVSRNGRALGISPEPARDYAIVERPPGINHPPLVADETQRQASRRLWADVVALNGELARLGPAILSATSARDYAVAVRDTGYPWTAAVPRTQTPVRALLKEIDGAFVLLAVNLDRRSVDARFDFGAPVRDLAHLFAARAAPAPDGNFWTERFEPFGVRVYRFRLGEAGG